MDFIGDILVDFIADRLLRLCRSLWRRLVRAIRGTWQLLGLLTLKRRP